jgi:hypothetical protein
MSASLERMLERNFWEAEAASVAVMKGRERKVSAVVWSRPKHRCGLIARARVMWMRHGEDVNGGSIAAPLEAAWWRWSEMESKTETAPKRSVSG